MDPDAVLMMMNKIIKKLPRNSRRAWVHKIHVVHRLVVQAALLRGGYEVDKSKLMVYIVCRDWIFTISMLYAYVIADKVSRPRTMIVWPNPALSIFDWEGDLQT
jgi:hypothetical protein